MTDPIAPDALREAAILAAASSMPGWNNGCLIPSATTNQDAVNAACIEVATPMVDAVLAEVAKHRDAEVERLRAETERLAAGWDASDAVTMQGIELIRTLTAERDDAQDRIARALADYRDLATYRVTHRNMGECPEGPDDPARDDACPVCAILTETKEQS